MSDDLRHESDVREPAADAGGVELPLGEPVEAAPQAVPTSDNLKVTQRVWQQADENGGAVHVPNQVSGFARPKVNAAFTLSGAERQAVEMGRDRLVLVALAFVACFAVLSLRLLDLSLLGGDVAPLATRLDANAPYGRAEIVDRNGALLATNLKTASVYADPSRVLDPADTARKLASVLPGLSVELTRQKLSGDGRFQWIERGLTPEQEAKVLALGLPGIGFRYESTRFYPHGPLASHVLGFVNVDDQGLEGIERSMNSELLGRGARGAPLVLSLDVRVQHAVRAELINSMKTFSAKAAAGVVMNVNTGEVLALVSLPDFDPNRAGESELEHRRNNAVSSRYEMGSTFKAFTTAMVLDEGVARLTTSYDATKPIKVGRFSIRDHHPEKRWLSVPEVFMHSSNIGSAKMALSVAPEQHWAFLKKLGLLDAPGVELSEAARPLTPEAWRDVNRMTVAFGHGIAVTPLHVATAMSSVVNGGLYHPATLLPVPEGSEGIGARRVLRKETSMLMRALLRLVVETGTGKKAEAKGYLVGGKTGTAEKSKARGYSRRSMVTSFAGIFPAHDPKYVVIALLDEPRGTKETWGFATAGWNAAPTVSHIVERIGPVLGLKPVDYNAPEVESVRALSVIQASAEKARKGGGR